MTIAQSFELRGQFADGANQPGPRAIRSVEAVHISQQQKPICVDCRGKQRAQFIMDNLMKMEQAAKAGVKTGAAVLGPDGEPAPPE